MSFFLGFLTSKKIFDLFKKLLLKKKSSLMMKPNGPLWLGDMDNRESTKVYPSQNQNALSIFFRQLFLLSSLFSVSSQTRNGRSVLPLHCSFLHQHNQSSTSHYTLFFFSSLCEFQPLLHSLLLTHFTFLLLTILLLIRLLYDVPRLNLKFPVKV